MPSLRVAAARRSRQRGARRFVKGGNARRGDISRRSSAKTFTISKRANMRLGDVERRSVRGGARAAVEMVFRSGERRRKPTVRVKRRRLGLDLSLRESKGRLRGVFRRRGGGEGHEGSPRS